VVQIDVFHKLVGFDSVFHRALLVFVAAAIFVVISLLLNYSLLVVFWFLAWRCLSDAWFSFRSLIDDSRRVAPFIWRSK
jgi:hypothetical protein